MAGLSGNIDHLNPIEVEVEVGLGLSLAKVFNLKGFVILTCCMYVRTQIWPKNMPRFNFRL